VSGRPDSPRERLLDAARAVIADDGLEGLSLRAIARRAGVSHGAPLRHFPTLAALLAAVGADGFASLVAAVDEAVARADADAVAAGRPLRAVDRLAVAGDAYVDVALARPGVFSVTFRPELCDVTDPDYAEQGVRAFGQLVDLVEAAQAEGWHPDLPLRHLAAVMWANVHGLAELIIHGAMQGVVGADQTDAVRAVAHRLLFGTRPDDHHPDPLDPLTSSDDDAHRGHRADHDREMAP
jgi:AcrR family transcriptional regulator